MKSNNNNNNIENQPLSSTSSKAVVDSKELNNITFEIVDSRIPTDEHVHVSNGDSTDSNSIELPTNETNDCVIPDSTTEAKVQVEQSESENESSSRRVLRELNQEDTTGQ